MLTVIGLREIHKTTTGRAVGALAIPLGIVLVIILIVAGSGVAKLGSSVSDRNVPNQEACNALETYIARVEGAVGLDGDRSIPRWMGQAVTSQRIWNPSRSNPAWHFSSRRPCSLEML